MARFDLGAAFRKAGDWIKNTALPWVDKTVSKVANAINPALGKAYDTVAEGIRQKRPAGDIIGDVAGQVPEILTAVGAPVAGEAVGAIRTGLEGLGVNIPGRKRMRK
jgi:hypothetical protein